MRPLPLLVLACCATAAAAAGAAPRSLMTGLPGADKPLSISGEQYMSPPAFDATGGLVVAWRAVSGFGGGDLLQTVFFQRVTASGATPLGSVPKVVLQCGLGSVDRSGNEASGERGLAGDGRGGAYYVFGPWLVRIDAQGKAVWHRGAAGTGETRAPSRVRVGGAAGIGLKDVSVRPDGRGNALLFYTCDKGTAFSQFRAQLVAPDGTTPWGPSGVEVTNSEATTPYAACVPDGKGGFIAHVPVGYHGHDSQVVFFDASGRRVRTGAPLGFPPDHHWVESDGSGGILILYEKGVFDGGGLLQHRYLRLVRVGADGRTRYDVQLSDELKHLKNVTFRAAADGTATATWMVTEGADKDDEKSVVDLYCGRVDADGKRPWGKPAKLSLPAYVGKDLLPNTEIDASLYPAGAETWLVYECMVKSAAPAAGSDVEQVLYAQRIDSRGNFASRGPGRRVSDGGDPWIGALGGKPAVLFWRPVTLAGAGDTVPAPHFSFLDSP